MLANTDEREFYFNSDEQKHHSFKNKKLKLIAFKTERSIFVPSKGKDHEQSRKNKTIYY